MREGIFDEYICRQWFCISFNILSCSYKCCLRMKSYLISLLLCIFGVNYVCQATVYPKSRSVVLKNLDISPVLYPYLVEPKDYPEYYRRPFPAVSWSDFGYRTQFVVGRNVPLDSTERATVKGNVYRPSIAFMRDMNFTAKLQFLSKTNSFLHNIGGYGPGSPYPRHGGFGEYIVPNWQIEQIKKYVGARFTGFDVGEQDGRFNFTYRKILEPYIPERKSQYLLSQPYFDRVASDQGNWCSALSVLWYWHPILKEGYTVLAGSETQNKITNGQVQYMHLRGAGKQYGILWYGDVSVFDSWGCKIYDSNKAYENVNKGGSLSLFKRSYYTQYMYNSTILSMEHGWCEGKWATNRGRLSPIGMMHDDCVDFVDKYGQPGVMVTQIALLNDFYSGWMPASHIASAFRVWNAMPYEAGDYLTDAVINMFYPNYDRSGFFYDETGAMCATPFGENVDALMSDARVEVMNQYPVMVAAGDLFSGGKELADKITSYVEQGGTFVVTAKNAARLWPEWGISEMSNLIPAGTQVQIGSEQIMENAAFKLYSSNLDDDVQVLARIGKTPVVLIKEIGEGKVILSLTEYGLNSEPYSVKEPPSWFKNEFDTFLERPYRLLNHFSCVLESVFSSVSLFSVGKDLGYIVNYLEDGKYRLAIYNNTWKSLPFKIKSNIGKIKSVKELSTGRKLFQCAGYWPHGVSGEVDGKDDAFNIYGGDIRLFDVEVEQSTVSVKEKIHQKNPVVGTYLAVDNMSFLKEKIRKMPTFFDYFDGVAVEGTAVMQMDIEALKRQNEWYALQSLDVAADLREGFNSGYWTFDEQNPNFQRTKKDLKGINERLRVLFGKHLLLIPEAFQKQCPEEWLAYYNICFMSADSSNSNWVTGRDAKLLNCSSWEWEHIYAAISGKKTKKPLIAETKGHTRPDNKHHILALSRYEDNIKEAISGVDCFYQAFGGVCVTAEYLANKSLSALQKEKEWWDQVGISVIVSFIEEINHFPGLTLCDAVPMHYEKSISYYKDVLYKMGKLGLKKALFTTQPSIEVRYPDVKVYEQMKKTFGLLSEYAEERGVKILLTNTRFRLMSNVAQQKQMIHEIANNTSLGLAINLNHLSKDNYESQLKIAGKDLEVVILGCMGSSDHSEYHPISNSGISADILNELKNVLLIEKVWPFTNEDIYKDCFYMNWLE